MNVGERLAMALYRVALRLHKPDPKRPADCYVCHRPWPCPDVIEVANRMDRIEARSKP